VLLERGRTGHGLLVLDVSAHLVAAVLAAAIELIVLPGRVRGDGSYKPEITSNAANAVWREIASVLAPNDPPPTSLNDELVKLSQRLFHQFEPHPDVELCRHSSSRCCRLLCYGVVVSRDHRPRSSARCDQHYRPQS
jgi:hypothetical protein